MRATLMYGAGDVRVETVPDPRIVEQTQFIGAPTRWHITKIPDWT